MDGYAGEQASLIGRGAMKVSTLREVRIMPSLILFRTVVGLEIVNSSSGNMGGQFSGASSAVLACDPYFITST